MASIQNDVKLEMPIREGDSSPPKSRGPPGPPGQMGPRGLTGLPGESCDKFHSKLQKQMEELKNEIEECRKDIVTIVQAVNEMRTQIQALTDYCFTDKSQWKEGQK